MNLSEPGRTGGESLTSRSAFSVLNPKSSLGVAGYLLAIAPLGPFLAKWVGTFSTDAQVGSITWRFGIFGTVYSQQFYLMFTLLALAVSAAYFQHRRVLFATAIASGVLALVIGIGLPAFALDFLQLRRTMAPRVFAPYRLAGMNAALLAAYGAPVFALLALAILRVARALEPPHHARNRDVLPPLVSVGR